jgi:hypothetical protein
LRISKNKTRTSSAGIVHNIGRTARQRAERQAQRVSWRMLVAFRNQYVEAECFLLWLRSIEDVAKHLPDSVWKAIEHEYPVFLDDDLPHLQSHAASPVWKRLDNWIFNNIFAEVRREGWMDAVVYYAAPDRRYLRAEAYWLKCAKEWKQKRPSSYPPFQQWRRAASKCSELHIVSPRLREILRPADHISADRLTGEVERYIDWEELVSWARTGLELLPTIPPVIEKELRLRCPGFLEYDAPLRRTDTPGQCRSWSRLIDWIIRHRFARAKREGWIPVIHYYKRLHPHWIRMVRYSSRRQHDGEGHIEPYPTFEEWCQAIDNYTGLGLDEGDDE